MKHTIVDTMSVRWGLRIELDLPSNRMRCGRCHFEFSFPLGLVYPCVLRPQVMLYSAQMLVQPGAHCGEVSPIMRCTASNQTSTLESFLGGNLNMR